MQLSNNCKNKEQHVETNRKRILIRSITGCMLCYPSESLHLLTINTYPYASLKDDFIYLIVVFGLTLFGGVFSFFLRLLILGWKCACIDCVQVEKPHCGRWFLIIIRIWRRCIAVGWLHLSCKSRLSQRPTTNDERMMHWGSPPPPHHDMYDIAKQA